MIGENARPVAQTAPKPKRGALEVGLAKFVWASHMSGKNARPSAQTRPEPNVKKTSRAEFNENCFEKAF